MTMLQKKQWKEVLIFSNYHYKNVFRLHYVGFCSSRFGVFYDRIFEFLTLCVNSGPNRGVKAMHIPAVAIQSHDSIDFRKVFAASRASGDISILNLIDLRRGSVARSAQSTWPGSCTRSSIGRPIG